MLGTSLGNYQVVEKLGEGGMGVVYVGRHETLGRRAVVKVLQAEMSRYPDMVQRFFNEAQAATAIRHPGIVQVFDFGTTASGYAFIVMELLEGQTLTARLEQRRLDPVACCRIARQVANALQAAHERGITHRDLKPDNLFLIPDDDVIGGERVKVLDFGIAKLAGELHGAGVRTRTGLMMGTPSYMSPEQCRSAVSADPRSDIYSLGCILFEMTCGRPPFTDGGMGDIIGAHLHAPPPHPQSLAPDLPAALAQLIIHLLAKQPNARPQTMAAVSKTLDEILRAIGESAARAPTPLPELDPTQPFEPGSVHRCGSQPPAPISVPPFARASAPTLMPTPTPTAARGPTASPLPQVSPISTTLGGSAGMSTPALHAAAGRLPFVFGGLVIATVLAVLVVVLATEGSPPQDPQLSPGERVVAPPSVDAAIRDSVDAAPPPPAVIAPDAAAEPSLPVGTGALEAECRGYQADRKWADLEQCADRLKSLAPERAAELGARAAEEARAAPRIRAVEAALRDQDLKRARAELDQVWSRSVGYPDLKRKYELAEAQAITDLAAALERVKDPDCEEHEALLAKERASRPIRVTTEAARRVPCSRQACIGDAFAEKGQEQYALDQLAAALASYEAAYNCRPTPEWSEKAFVISCNLGDLSRAKLHWKRLPPNKQTRALGICIRNKITEEMLSAP